MGFGTLDFFIMLCVVAIIAWFATKSRKKRKSTLEERALLPEATLYTNQSPLLRIPKAELGAKPFFLCFDTETVDLISNSESTGYPPVVTISYALLTEEGRAICKQCEIIKSPFPISKEAVAIHGITEEMRRERGREFSDVIEDFRHALSLCKIVVAHNLEFHKKTIDNTINLCNLPILEWESKATFCTMEKGERYLQVLEDDYSLVHPSLRRLYSKLFYDRYDMHFIESNKSEADLLLVVACLSYLYNESDDSAIHR